MNPNTIIFTNKFRASKLKGFKASKTGAANATTMNPSPKLRNVQKIPVKPIGPYIKNREISKDSGFLSPEKIFSKMKRMILEVINDPPIIHRMTYESNVSDIRMETKVRNPKKKFSIDSKQSLSTPILGVE